jgi:HEAT repeat protein
MSWPLRRRPADATERMRRLDRRAGCSALLDAVHDPSIDVARRALGWLAHEGGPTERTALRDVVWTCDPNLVMDVAGTLRALGDRDTVDVAIRRLSATPTAERCRAARVLERFADPRARPALCAALDDEDASVRGAALDALARLGTNADVARNAARLIGDASGEVRRRAVRAVGRASRRPADAVRLALHDPLPAVRREAARLSTRLDADEIETLLTDNDPHVRAAAVTHAGHGSMHALTAALASDQHPAVRLAAAQTLGRIGGEDAGAALLAAALDDAEATVRARALRLSSQASSHPRLVASLRAELAIGRARRREMALRSLAKLSVRIPAADVLRLAGDPEPAVRLALAQVALTVSESPDAVFSALARDDDPTVRHAAALYRERLER